MSLEFGKYFGEGNVIDKDGHAVKFDQNAHEVIGLYFSAHWCPPCRGFTPKLAEYYTTAEAKNPGALEIIFISSDQNETEFKNYLKEMPWKALSFKNRTEKDKLSSMYGISGIPTLVFLKSDGSLFNKDGRALVMSDTECTMSWLSK